MRIIFSFISCMVLFDFAALHSQTDEQELFEQVQKKKNGFGNSFHSNSLEHHDFAKGAISSNPAIPNRVFPVGKLFEWLGLERSSGLLIGGLWIPDTSVLFKRGPMLLPPSSPDFSKQCHKWTGNNLFILGLGVDLNTWLHIPGAAFSVQMLRGDSQPTNALAGVVQGFDNLPGVPEHATRLFQLWYRQIFGKKAIMRVGKTVTASDFNNVIYPLALRHDPTSQMAQSGLLYRPIFLNATMFGIVPGIFNSIYGANCAYFPTDQTYVIFGEYDGSYAHTFDTTLTPSPKRGTYSLSMLEGGGMWHVGADAKPGCLGIGAWAQTGRLIIPPSQSVTKMEISECGALGWYLFGTQRLWFANPGVDSSGIVGLFQFGMNNSRTRPVDLYGGAALTFFGLVPRRPQDSFGCGVASSRLNTCIFPRRNETMLQAYYQMHLGKTVYFISALSYIPNPGLTKAINNMAAYTGRIVVIF